MSEPTGKEHVGSPAPTGEEQVAEVLADIAADPERRPVLLALDFDGTLAPLQDDPARSRILPDGVTALADLAGHDGVALALVSGRSMQDLHALAQVPPGTYLIGSHGAERARVTAHGLDRDDVQLTDAEADRLAALGGELARVARGRDGVWVESKPTAAVVHTRMAEPDDAEAALAAAREVATRLGAEMMSGKDVLEMSVLRTSKGEALGALRRELGAHTVVYAGDDVTDERAFDALEDGDVTIKVGEGPTVARHRVADPDAVVRLLADLVGRLAAGTTADPTHRTS